MERRKLLIRLFRYKQRSSRKETVNKNAIYLLTDVEMEISV